MRKLNAKELFKSLAARAGRGIGGRPEALASSATYRQALDKLSEIISYCESNPAGQNAFYRESAIACKNGMCAAKNNWRAIGPSCIIPAISAIISTLT
jgi:hypothetical protein